MPWQIIARWDCLVVPLDKHGRIICEVDGCRKVRGFVRLADIFSGRIRCIFHGLDAGVIEASLTSISAKRIISNGNVALVISTICRIYSSS